MTTVWGLLEKSQSDNQKIEEAIDAAIEAHEADENAHLGVGESLQSHKASEIIDHVQGSIVGDKFSASERTMITNFENLAMFSLTGDVTSGGWGYTGIYVNKGETDLSKIMPLSTPIPGYFDCGDSWLFDVKGYYDGNDDVDWDILFSPYEALKAGFRWRSGVLKGFLYYDSAYHETATISVSMTGILYFRVFHDATTNTLYFFINGTQVATMDTTGIDDQGMADYELKLTALTGGEGSYIVNSMRISIF